MHEKLQELIDYTSNKFQLTDFHLKRYHIFKEKNHMNEIAYTFNMEWFPDGISENEKGSNPQGTISIDLDFHSRALKSIIFVAGINKLEADLPEANDMEGAIEWVEKETALDFGRQFKLVDSDITQLKFHAAADNIPVFPSGHIQLNFNDEGKLSLFSIYGVFPPAEKISWEPFNITSEDTEIIVRNQCALFEVPIVDQEKWQSVYSISNSFITNKEQHVLSYEEVEADASFTQLQEVLEWNTPSTREFTKKEIDIGTESTIEAALAKEQTYANEPITDEDQQKIITTARHFLQSTFPNDSGKWKANSARREADYLFVVLKPIARDTRILQRKLTVVLESETFEPVNYIDNSVLLDTFQTFTKAERPKLSQEEAFDILYKYVEVIPVYVFNKEQDTYKLCGQVKCDYAVDAVTGALIKFDDLN